MAIFVGVTRFAVPAGEEWRYGGRIGDLELNLSFGDRRGYRYAGGTIAERVVRIHIAVYPLMTTSLDYYDDGPLMPTILDWGDVTRLLGPWRGFDVHFYHSSDSQSLTVQTPASFVFCLLLVYPALSITRDLLRRWRRRRRGLCRRCGYNLEGNVSGLCPECGTERSKECNAH